MQLKNFYIRIDIKRKIETEPIEVVQGDTSSNALNITLLDGGAPYDLYNLNVKIVFRKADGTTVEQTDIEKVNDVQGKIVCILKSNTIAIPGEVIAEVKVFDDERIASSTTFRFYVRKSLEDDETIESTNEFTTLMRLINETNGLITEVKKIEAQVPEGVVERIDNLEELIDALEIEVNNVENNLGTRINALNDNLAGLGAHIGTAIFPSSATGAVYHSSMMPLFAASLRTIILTRVTIIGEIELTASEWGLLIVSKQTDGIRISCADTTLSAKISGKAVNVYYSVS